MVLGKMRLLCIAALAGVVSACAYVPFDAPREVTRALSTEQSAFLHPVVASELGPNPTRSGYFELSSGTDALGARLRMIEQARHSLDIATFLIKPDTASKLIMNRIFDAADRGVRVRFLFDDVFTTVPDEDLAALDAHRNIEMRVFNPTSRNAPKQMGFLWDFKRVNRRMHIKSFVMDGSIAIMGGRNYADEYYELKPTQAFADYDVLIFGPEARELDLAFDTYWNDQLSVPLANFDVVAKNGKTITDDPTWRYDISDAEIDAYRQAISTPYLAEIDNGTRAPFWGTSELVFDTPDKLRNPDGQGPHILGEHLFAEMRRSTDQVTLITPYFVPENYGARFFQDLRAQGIKVRIITNSLASNNHAYVHGGYTRHRKALLETGVELYELREDALNALGDIPADQDLPITLHTKMAIFDQDRVFVGSLNLDPRSVKTNSEIGLFIQSPAYATALLKRLETSLTNYAYQVTLDDNGEFVWTWSGGPEEVAYKEPGATGWQHFLAVLPQVFGLEGLL
ncbi:MAG: phospholipase D family protein [Shimia thalassica]|uniref:phospholipase D family protein n=2 Tax=Pseudomonadota TaxID=1224 RepID=UPI003299A7BE